MPAGLWSWVPDPCPSFSLLRARRLEVPVPACGGPSAHHRHPDSVGVCSRWLAAQVSDWMKPRADLDLPVRVFSIAPREGAICRQLFFSPDTVPAAWCVECLPATMLRRPGASLRGRLLPQAA